MSRRNHPTPVTLQGAGGQVGDRKASNVLCPRRAAPPFPALDSSPGLSPAPTSSSDCFLFRLPPCSRELPCLEPRGPQSPNTWRVRGWWAGRSGVVFFDCDSCPLKGLVPLESLGLHPPVPHHSPRHARLGSRPTAGVSTPPLRPGPGRGPLQTLTARTWPCSENAVKRTVPFSRRTRCIPAIGRHADPLAPASGGGPRTFPSSRSGEGVRPQREKGPDGLGSVFRESLCESERF